MTMFKDDFDPFYALMFGFLFFIKVFHWLSSDRVDYMVQYQNASNLIITRLTIAFSGLLLADSVFLTICCIDIYFNGVSMIALFASEYAILLATAFTGFITFAINLAELRSQRAWENKSLYILYVDLFGDFLKLSTYVMFFGIMVTTTGFPLNLIRDLFITARSFVLRVKDLQRYKKATHNLDRLYPAASLPEIEALSDKLCIICRDDLVHPSQHPEPWESGLDETPKKLPCRHIFHRHCLKSWLERQQTCPTCRTSVTSQPQNSNNDNRNNNTDHNRQQQQQQQQQSQSQTAQYEQANQTNQTNQTNQHQRSQSTSTSVPTPASTSTPNRNESRFGNEPISNFSRIRSELLRNTLNNQNTSNELNSHPMSQLLTIPDVQLPIISPDSNALPSQYNIWSKAYNNEINNKNKNKNKDDVSANKHKKQPSFSESSLTESAKKRINNLELSSQELIHPSLASCIPLPPSPTTSSKEYENIYIDTSQLPKTLLINNHNDLNINNERNDGNNNEDNVEDDVESRLNALIKAQNNINLAINDLVDVVANDNKGKKRQSKEYDQDSKRVKLDNLT